MYATGNMDYADSQRQSSISLEVCMSAGTHIIFLLISLANLNCLHSHCFILAPVWQSLPYDMKLQSV